MIKILQIARSDFDDMLIEYEDEETHTYYWRIKPDETNVYAFYSRDWDELGYTQLTIFDKNNKIVPRNDSVWCLKGGQEYVLRVSYQYDYYCYDDVVFWLETYREHTHTYKNSCDTNCDVCEAIRVANHTYSNTCDTSCNVCGTTRTVSHIYRTTTTKATTSKNGSIVKMCTACGNIASNTTIKYAKTFKLSTTSYTYSGSAKKPTVKVYDSAGKLISASNYTVSYKNNKNVGKATVTIKFKGNYSGSKTLSFTINPKATSVSKLTTASKSLKVSIKKQSTQVTGYEMQYSTSKKFTKSTTKTKTIKSYKTTSTTIKSLKAKKTYYVRVRTYKTVNGKKYYSTWSTTKSKKTK